MSELPGQISRDDDLNKPRNNVESHLNGFDKGLTKSDTLHNSTHSTTIRRPNFWNNRTNSTDTKTSCPENKFEFEDKKKINNSHNNELLLRDKRVTTRYYNTLAEPNNGNRASMIKFNVKTPNEKRYVKKGKSNTTQQSSNIPQDIKHLRKTNGIHQITPDPQENKYISTDEDDDDDDDGNNTLLCEGDVVTNYLKVIRDDGDKQDNEELDEKRWAEKVLKDKKHKPGEVAGTKKLYQRGCKSEAASRIEMIRLMQNSVLGDSFRRSLYSAQNTDVDDKMEVSSIESLTWVERPVTPITSDSQEHEEDEEEGCNRKENVSKPVPSSQSEDSFFSSGSVQKTNAQTFPFSFQNRFQYFLDVPDQLDVLVPAEHGTVVKCHIIKYTNGMVRNFCPIYYLYVMNENGVGTFLLAARKRFKCMGSSYVICKDSIDLSRGGSSYVAKLKANLVGTEYRLLCKRCHAEKSQKARKSQTIVKPLNEIAGIIYEYANILGISNPETLTVVIPRLSSCQERMEVIVDDRQEGLIEKWRQHELDDIIEMPNKKPWINEETNRYELNFYGRSPEYSYKNFQILCNDSIALQVGQMDKDIFFMDFQYPLCTLQAFAVALSCLDRK